MAKIHEYPAHVSWSGGRTGSGSVTANRSGVEFPISAPPEFGGPGQGTNPEELLASSVAACYTITFGIIASNRKLPVVSLEVDAVGEVEENGPQFTYKRITVSPSITLAPESTDDQLKAAEDMAHKADLYCIITNAVREKVAIVVEPTVKRG